MGKDSGIQWCHHTFNPWWGCEKVSAGCRGCYAESFSKRVGLRIWGGESTGRRLFGDKHWAEPLKWNRTAEKAGERERVFCASMADVGEDRPDLVEPRARLVGTIRITPWLDWLLLTKRPENLPRLFAAFGERWPDNVWVGTTAEDEDNATRRVQRLLAIKARTHFLSVEPMLASINLCVLRTGDFDSLDALSGEKSYAGRGALPGHTSQAFRKGIDWVICGGESGPKARPFDVAWARSLRDQCKAAGVAFFMKQMGAHPVDEGNGWPRGTRLVERLDDVGARIIQQGWRVRLNDSHGGDPAEWPEDLRVREFPAVPS